MEDYEKKYVERLLEPLRQQYQEVVGRLTELVQEIPPEILLAADMVEQSTPEGMTTSEVVAYANGMRYAAYLTTQAINAHMMADEAEARGEYDA